MFIDPDDIDEVQYLALMFVMNVSSDIRYVVDMEGILRDLDMVVAPEEADAALSALQEKSLIFISDDERTDLEFRRGLKARVGLSFAGMAVLVNYPNRFLGRINDRFGDVPEYLTASLVPYLNLERVPAADRYVSTSDNLPQFKALAENLEVIRQEIVKDQNRNELPIKQKRAVIAELQGLIAQIRGGFVKLSDLTNRARPLLKSIAEVCRDVTVIAVAISSALGAIAQILKAFH